MNNKQIQVDAQKLPNVACECKNIFWEKVLLAKKVPGLLVGSSTDQLINIEVLRCTDCKQVFIDQIQLAYPPLNTFPTGEDQRFKTLNV